MNKQDWEINIKLRIDNKAVEAIKRETELKTTHDVLTVMCEDYAGAFSGLQDGIVSVKSVTHNCKNLLKLTR